MSGCAGYPAPGDGGEPYRTEIQRERLRALALALPTQALLLRAKRGWSHRTLPGQASHCTAAAAGQRTDSGWASAAPVRAGPGSTTRMGELLQGRSAGTGSA